VPANPETGVGKKFPMRFEQVQLAQEMAVRNLITPHNPDQNLPSTVAKRVNALEFVDAALRFPHDIHTYTGAPQRFDRIGRESQRSYTARQIQAIEPLLLVSDRIGLDNTLGSRPAFDPFFNTKNGVIADLVKAITSRGVKVDIEPCNYVSDDWLNLCGKVIAEDFIRDRTRLNKGKSVWDDRVGIKDRTTGMIYHHEPFAIPGTFGEPVMIIADTQYEWSDEQVMVHLQKLHDDYPTADLLVHAGHLPWRLAE
jgi:hypothetical protein